MLIPENWRDKWERQSNAPTPTDEFQAANFHFDRGRQYCAAELQAWLGEAEKWTRHCDSECDSAGQIRGVSTEGVRRELLGTTKEGKGVMPNDP